MLKPPHRSVKAKMGGSTLPKWTEPASIDWILVIVEMTPGSSKEAPGSLKIFS